MERLHFIFTVLLQWYRSKAPVTFILQTQLQGIKKIDLLCIDLVHLLKLQVLLDQTFNLAFLNIAVRVTCILNTTVIPI